MFLKDKYMRPLFFILCLSLLLCSGCSVTSKGYGIMPRSNETFHAELKQNILSGSSHVVFYNDQGFSCTGTSRITHLPDESIIFLCTGARGNMYMGCNDGRILSLRVNFESCASGSGLGQDTQRNPVIFVWGGDEATLPSRIGGADLAARARGVEPGNSASYFAQTSGRGAPANTGRAPQGDAFTRDDSWVPVFEDGDIHWEDDVGFFTNTDTSVRVTEGEPPIRYAPNPGSSPPPAASSRPPAGRSVNHAAWLAGSVPKNYELVGFGTGFFITADGLLVTNAHVLKGGDSFDIYHSKRRERIPVKVLEYDMVNDIAVLKADYKADPLPLSGRFGAAKGEEVFTLGYPEPKVQGPEQKATFGRINALSGLQGDRRMTQVDLPVHPGNSGGPLFNSRGEVIGVITSRLDPELATSVNYAMKIDYLYPLLAELEPGFAPDKGKAGRSMSELVADLEDSVVMIRVFRKK